MHSEKGIIIQKNKFLMKILYGILLYVCTLGNIISQTTFSYFLPQSVKYDSTIPTPKKIIGHEVGEWHITHDRLVQYMYALAQASNRITIQEQARTYENRPTLLLTITSLENHQKIGNIQATHLNFSNPIHSFILNTDTMPVVLWMGYSIHGNEASGSNAALLVAYHLAAAQDKNTTEWLKHTIVLLDPSFNPDGLNRFATWVNMHKSKNLVSDPYSREFNEVWPQGRTNHYWFDMNRDWLFAQLPESKGRIRSFQKWRPNVLTDHHEMGSEATFFFQPGIPSRRNPLTPDRNVALTKKIALFHSKALDKIGALYYTQESFDDFYYGKGSTYPDIQGAIGILFEQASARGHKRQTTHGILSFPFAIKNHFVTSLSTLEAAYTHRKELLEYQRTFYMKNIQNAKSDDLKAYIFSEEYDQVRLFHFMEILQIHKIRIYRSNEDIILKEKTYSKEHTYIVPLSQPQYRLIKTIFSTQITFNDSLFYDVSTWTLPLAFNMSYDEIRKKDFSKAFLGKEVKKLSFPSGKWIGGKSKIAYAFDWSPYFAPRSLYRLQAAGIRTKVNTKQMEIRIENISKNFNYGTISVPLGIQTTSREKIESILTEIMQKDGIDIYALKTGLSIKGVDLGSNALKNLKKPIVALFVGDGINAYEAGEVWHLLDQRYHMPISHIEIATFNEINPQKYNTLIMVQGQYGKIDSKKMKMWIQNGGTLILIKNAAKWASQRGIIDLKFKKSIPLDTTSVRSYSFLQNDIGKNYIGGAILEAKIDITHPLGYGYTSNKIALFRNSTLFVEKRKNPYASPVLYTENPLLSGYISNENKQLISETVSVAVNVLGKGKIISLIDNPNFRGFWYGTNKLFANAIFFGRIIDVTSAK